MIFVFFVLCCNFMIPQGQAGVLKLINFPQSRGGGGAGAKTSMFPYLPKVALGNCNCYPRGEVTMIGA